MWLCKVTMGKMNILKVLGIILATNCLKKLASVSSRHCAPSYISTDAFVLSPYTLSCFFEEFMTTKKNKNKKQTCKNKIET